MRQPAARTPRWPALLLVLIPGLLAPKGCYFGEQDVPLGGNRDPAAGGQSGNDTGDSGDASDSGNSWDSDTSGASGNGGASSVRPGTEMRAPGVFQVH